MLFRSIFLAALTVLLVTGYPHSQPPTKHSKHVSLDFLNKTLAQYNNQTIWKYYQHAGRDSNTEIPSEDLPELPMKCITCFRDMCYNECYMQFNSESVVDHPYGVWSQVSSAVCLAANSKGTATISITQSASFSISWKTGFSAKLDEILSLSMDTTLTSTTTSQTGYSLPVSPGQQGYAGFQPTYTTVKGAAAFYDNAHNNLVGSVEVTFDNPKVLNGFTVGTFQLMVQKTNSDCSDGGLSILQSSSTTVSGTCTSGFLGTSSGNGPQCACCSAEGDCNQDCVGGVCTDSTGSTDGCGASVSPNGGGSSGGGGSTGSCSTGFAGLGNGGGLKCACCTASNDCKESCYGGICSDSTGDTSGCGSSTGGGGGGGGPSCTPGYSGTKSGNGPNGSCCATESDCNFDCTNGVCNGS